jgi:hypothetical protein
MFVTTTELESRTSVDQGNARRNVTLSTREISGQDEKQEANPLLPLLCPLVPSSVICDFQAFCEQIVEV